MPVPIHADMPRADYDALDALNASGINRGTKSLMHLRHALENREETAALSLGWLTHGLILEPEVVADEVVIVEASTKTTKIWKEQSEAAIASGKRPFLLHEYESALEMGRAVRDAPVYRKVLADCFDPMTEATIVWEDTDDGATRWKAKMRCDLIDPSAGILLDIKTTLDASPEAFRWSVLKYGYHRQAAWYIRGAMAAGVEAPRFLIVAVEKGAPNGVGVYEIPADVLAQGWAECAAIASRWSEAKRTGIWPGYSDGIVMLPVRPKYEVNLEEVAL